MEEQESWMSVNKKLLVKSIIYSSDETRKEIARNLRSLI